MAIVYVRDPNANPKSPHSSSDATHGEHRGPKKPMSHSSKSHSSKSHSSKSHPFHEPLAPSSHQSEHQSNQSQNPTNPSQGVSSEWSAPNRRRLGSYLLEAGLINHAQIEVVLNDQQMMKEMRFGEVLVVRGWIKPETIDFVMRRVVEPERAYQSHQEQPVIDNTQPTIPPEVSPPPFPTSPPQSKIVARARSVDGEFEFDIVDQRSVEQRSQNSSPTTPFIRSTDSGQSRNDRKSLPSTPDGDGVNWAG